MIFFKKSERPIAAGDKSLLFSFFTRYKNVTVHKGHEQLPQYNF